MRGNDGKKHFSEKERGEVWKDYMKESCMKEMTVVTMRKEM